MQCPKCKVGQLVPNYLELFFCARKCNGCGGDWLLIEDYVNWKEQHPEFEFVEVDVTEIIEDSKHAMLCPVSGLIMRKLRMTKDVPHRLDYSASVGGVFLDKGEWELLKSEGLAGVLNTILTQHWQQKIRAQTTEDTFDSLYLAKFGEADYDKIKALREWITTHPKRADIRSFLFAQDPYSVKR